MANPHLARTLVEFEATVHRTKNRLIAIPAKIQRQLGLRRRANNHIVLYSIRPSGRGRWNHHLAYLTHDNEFSVPADVEHIKQGARVDVKIHRVVPDGDALASSGAGASAGALLTSLGDEAGEDDRSDGSTNVDEYLRAEAGG